MPFVFLKQYFSEIPPLAGNLKRMNLFIFFDQPLVHFFYLESIEVAKFKEVI